MSGQFSAEIERLAEKFKMTVAGKIRLAGFSDLILTTAYSRLLKKNTHQEIRTPFLMYFKTCEFAASDLHIPYNNDKVQKLCQQFGIHNILREDYTTPEGRNTWPITGKHQIVEQKKAQSQAKYASLAAEQEAYFEAHGIPQEGLPSRQPGNEWAIGLHDNEIIAECVKLRTTFQGPLFGKPLASNKVPLDVPLPEHKRNFTPTEVDLIIWFRQLERNVRAQFPKLPEEYVKINELINNRSDILETFLTNMKEFYEQTNSSV